MKKLIIGIIVILTLLAGCGANNEKDDTSNGITETDSEHLELDEPSDNNIDDSESVKEINDEENFQGLISDIKYLERDELLCISLTDYTTIFYDVKNNNLINDPELKSEYLTAERESDSNKNIRVYDFLGNDVTDRFIADFEHENIIGVCHLEANDVIWVKEYNETPEHSEIIVKAFDELGNEICRVSSDNEYFAEMVDYIERFKNISTVEYVGDNVCRIMTTDSSTRNFFSVNVENSKILNGNGYFSDGYSVISAINEYAIQNTEGEYLVGPVTSHEILNNAYRYSDGLFFSGNTKKFYDIDLTEKIDLSQYEVVFIESDADMYVFQDGYCGIQVMNDSGTIFFGIIDTEGNWVIELTDTLNWQADEYRGKISENIIRLGRDKTFNLQSMEFGVYPDLPSNGENIDGKYYYINDVDELWYYDFENQENNKVSFV